MKKLITSICKSCRRTFEHSASRQAKTCSKPCKQAESRKRIAARRAPLELAQEYIRMKETAAWYKQLEARRFAEVAALLAEPAGDPGGDATPPTLQDIYTAVISWDHVNEDHAYTVVLRPASMLQIPKLVAQEQSPRQIAAILLGLK